ncbi:MAG: diguanylate cyclase [Alphaproteobacteria bacterium]|nr:diguanylate cyclase [Alphaproteobacteria bacterium]
MKILVVDRDRLSTQMFASRLAPKGHTIIEEAVKNEALERIGREEFDAVFIDPSPLTNPRPIILGIRRSIRRYPYIVLMATEANQEEAIRAGTNDVVSKPLNGEDLEKCVDNAKRLVSLVTRIGDDSEDYPSAGGVIAKSAFNQLFLSAMDRADRYGERTFLLFISVANYGDIFENDGPYAADFAVAKLSQNLVRLRRQSDIIGQTGKSEYALLLQRPQYETEPLEAANRFAESLAKIDDLLRSGMSDVKIAVELVDLPVGALHVRHRIGPASNG